MAFSSFCCWIKGIGKSPPRGRHEPKPTWRPKRTCRLSLEVLEDRTVPATLFEVTNLNDSGPGSLREAILGANSTPNGKTGIDGIEFQAGLTGTITLTSGQLNVTDAVTITGPGSGVLAVSGNNISRIFLVDDSSTGLQTVEISGLTLIQGQAGSGFGGAIQVRENLTLRDVVLTGNVASGGGGIAVVGGRLWLENSTVSGNHAVGFLGGGILVELGGNLTVERTTISGNRTNASGGGIAFRGGSLSVRDSTISGNGAVAGGGIAVERGIAFLSYSTISGNEATRDGGGVSFVDLSGSGLVHIVGCTIAANKADSDNAVAGAGQGDSGGGIYVRIDPGGPVSFSLYNTIIADNTVGLTGRHPDLFSFITGGVSARHCLVENAEGALPFFTPDSRNIILFQDPRLGPLAFNGGPTQTHAVLAGSPAINAGGPVSNPPVNDQRGAPFLRVVGPAIDIGAFEVQPPSPPSADLPTNPPPLPQIVAVVFKQKGKAKVRVIDSATGAVRGVLTPFKGFRGRLRLLLRDLNGDGSLDLVVRAVINGKRKTKAYNAVTLAPLPPNLA